MRQYILISKVWSYIEIKWKNSIHIAVILIKNYKTTIHFFKTSKFTKNAIYYILFIEDLIVPRILFLVCDLVLLINKCKRFTEFLVFRLEHIWMLNIALCERSFHSGLNSLFIKQFIKAVTLVFTEVKNIKNRILSFQRWIQELMSLSDVAPLKSIACMS